MVRMTNTTDAPETNAEALSDLLDEDELCAHFGHPIDTENGETVCHCGNRHTYEPNETFDAIPAGYDGDDEDF